MTDQKLKRVRQELELATSNCLTVGSTNFDLASLEKCVQWR